MPVETSVIVRNQQHCPRIRDSLHSPNLLTVVTQLSQIRKSLNQHPNQVQQQYFKCHFIYTVQYFTQPLET